MTHKPRLLLLASLFTLVAILGLGFRPSTIDAQGPPADLEALNNQLLPLFQLPGVVYTDADETTGRLVVGVSNHGIETAINAQLSALGVDADLVDIVDSPEIYNVESLQTGVFRPVLAGVQINFPGYLCSLGFNAQLSDGTNGFVTASHCTTTQGGVESTPYYQPLESQQPISIGTETLDPSYDSGGDCPSGKVCRYSDSAFVTYENGATGTVGAIARTSGPNNGSLDSVGTFSITAEGSGVGVGTTVDKVGRTTGWTEGYVSSTCANVGVSGTDIVQLCQNIVSSSKGAIVKAGDSGSPVFTISSGNDVTLQGILWGGSRNGRTMVYSTIANVEAELGALTTEASGAPQPQTTGTIDGQVTDATTNAAIAYAQVSTDTGQSGLTDSTGHYTIADVPTGSRSVTASADGYTTDVAQVSVTENTTATQDFSLVSVPVGSTVGVTSINYATNGGRNGTNHLRITLTVQDDTGQPVGGATVSIDLYRDGGNIASGSGSTASDGTVTFTLHNASPGLYTTTVTGVDAAGLTWDGNTPVNSFNKLQ
jgi:hypothetical protein